MASLGWSGGSQFSSTVLPVGAPVMVSMRGGEGAVGIVGVKMKAIHDKRAFTYIICGKRNVSLN